MKNMKLIALVLAVLMILLSIPFSAVAATLTTPDTYSTEVLNEENLVLSMANLASDNALSNGVTVGEAVAVNAITADGNDLKKTAKSRAFSTYNRATSIDLTESSKYTIQYTATLPAVSETFEWTMFGFSFCGTGNTALTLWRSNHISSVNQLYLSKRDQPHEGARYSVGNVFIPNTTDITGEHTYLISIDETVITFFIDGIKMGTFNYDGGNAKLSVGVRIHADNNKTGSEENAVVCSLKDIKVYEGAYGAVKTPGTPNYHDGDTLLKIFTPFNVGLRDGEKVSEEGDERYGVKYDDIILAQEMPMNSFKNSSSTKPNGNEGLESDILYAPSNKNAGSYVFDLGAGTNLPLNGSSKYTIEFYAKKYIEKLDISLCFDMTSAWAKSRGIYFSDDTVATIEKDTVGVQKIVGTEETSVKLYNMWTEYADEDGYTRFIIEIDGYTARVIVGTRALWTFDFEYYQATTLGLAIRGKVLDKTVFPTVGCPILSVKNLTVYAGAPYKDIQSGCLVGFSKDGESLGSKSADLYGVLNAEDFPEVSAADGKIIKWFYKNTNVMITVPYTVTGDVSLEAREIDPNAVNVAAMQYTEATDGKQNVRFISTIHSLQASEAGFEIRAVYKDNESAIKADKSWNVKSTVVYSSIQTTTPSGTVKSVSANELGGTYLLALAVNGVPAGYEQIDFYVTSYIIVNGEKKVSEEVRFTMSNGSVNTTLDPLANP